MKTTADGLASFRIVLSQITGIGSRMTNANHYVDLSSWPPDEQPHIMEFARAHNHLGVKVDAMKEDLDGISGKTEQEKEEFHAAMGGLRKVFHFFHSHRFNVLVASATGSCFIFMAKQLGMKPEQFSRLIDALIALMEKAGA
jgi:hypothetical protein